MEEAHDSENDNNWMRYYREDKDIKSKYFLADGKLRPDVRFSQGRIWHDDRILVPSAKIVDVIANYHNADHWGVSKTVDLIQRKHEIPAIWNRVRSFVQQCIDCQRTKPKTSRTPIKWMQIPCQRWHTVHLDWIEGLPTCTQARYDSILVIVDSATRLTHLAPTRKDSTSMQTAQLLIRELIQHHGIPRVLRTDRDRRVTSQLWINICKGLAIKPTLTVSTNTHALMVQLNELIRLSVNSYAFVARNQTIGFRHYQQRKWRLILVRLKEPFTHCGILISAIT